MLVSWIAAPLAVSILGGKSFVASVLPFRILILALPFVLINNIQYYLLLALPKIKGLFWTLMASLVFNVVINYLVIPKYGFVGTSISTVLTEFVTLLGYSIVLRNYKKSL